MEYTFKTNGRIVSKMFASYTNTFVALCELINNSLQAKAKVINITVSETGSSLLDKRIDYIEVKDNGDGVCQSEFEKKIFEIGTDTKDDGQGIGRFAAFQIGEALTIETVAYDQKLLTHTKTSLALSVSTLQGAIEDKKVEVKHIALSNETDSYYTVKISNIYTDEETKKEPRKKSHKNLYKDKIAEALFLQYPLYILQNKVIFTINDKPINKDDYIVGDVCERDEIFIDTDGVEHPTKLSFLRYKSVKNTVKAYLRVDNSDIKTVAHSFDYTCDLPETDSWLVYADSDLFNDNKDIFRTLSVAEIEPTANHFIKSIKGFIDKYFCETFPEYYNFAKKLKTDTYYPYRKENASSDSKAVVFNQLAYFIEEEYKLLSSNSKIRKVVYPLIDKALSHGELTEILEHILTLNSDTIKKFKELIEKSKLEEIIFFTDEIARKTQFLDFLHNIVYGKPAKYIKERCQLHKILVKQLWLFGEQFATSPTLFSDKNLQDNLVQLRDKCFNYELTKDDDNLVEIEDEKIRDITDLFFFNERRVDNEKMEIMIVELKRPSCRISQKELYQVDKYLYDIEKAGCFPSDAIYKIFLISSDFADFAKSKVGSIDKTRPNLYAVSKDRNIETFVYKWSDILHNNRKKLSYLGNVLKTEDVDTKKLVQKEYPELITTGLFSSLTNEAILCPNTAATKKRRKAK